MESSFESFHEWDTYIKKSMAEGGYINIKLSLLHVNIRSICKHFDQLTVLLSGRLHLLDILILTEVNADEASCASFSLPGFHSYNICREGRRGGGIILYINDKWLSERIHVELQNAEICVATVHNADSSYIVCAVYRPPSSNINTFCEELAKLLPKFDNNKYLVLAGDFNIDVSNETKHGVLCYLDTLSSFGLENVIQDYTREEYYGNKITKSCIDHIITRISNLHTLSGVVKQKVADHYVTVLSVLGENMFGNSKESEYKTVLDSKKIDNLIQRYDWNSLLHLDHLTAYDKLVDVFRDIYSNSTRNVKLKKRRPENIWINSDIIELCHQKDKLWKRCKQNPGDILLKKEFREIRNKVTAKIRLAKRNHYENQFKTSTRNPKKTWNLVNQLIGKKSTNSIDDTIQKHFHGTSSYKALSESFNKSFIEEVKVQRSKIPTTSLNDATSQISSANSAYLPDMTETDLSRIIHTMSLTKSPGIDRIRVRDIRYNFDKVKNILLKIVNDTLHSGNIPNGLKVSVIRPLYKKGKQQEFGSYRPISILPIMAHVIEKWVETSMSNFCDTFSLLSTVQYGFRRQMSTITLLEDFADCIHEALDKNNIALALFLDLSKAFDTIDHSLLLNKLYNMGFRGPFYQFFQNYFKDRFQMVKIMNNFSSPERVQFGVPQGSTLGPMLFNIYTNELGFLPLQSKIFQYADDTVLVLPHEKYDDAVSVFQRDIDKLAGWFAANFISVNVAKTKLICFRNPHKRISMSPNIFLHSTHCSNCCCKPLPYDSSVKYLGIYMDEHMQWNAQVEFVAKKLRTISAHLYKIKSVCSLKIRLMVFKALAESALRYGITLYGHCSQYKVRVIDRIIKHMVNNISYGTSYQLLETDDKAKELGILFFKDFFTFVAIKNNYFINAYKTPVNKSRDLRRTERYVIPRIYTLYGKKHRNYYIPSLFNTLPESLMNLTSTRVLKRELKKWCHNSVSKVP